MVRRSLFHSQCASHGRPHEVNDVVFVLAVCEVYLDVVEGLQDDSKHDVDENHAVYHGEHKEQDRRHGIGNVHRLEIELAEHHLEAGLDGGDKSRELLELHEEHEVEEATESEENDPESNEEDGEFIPAESDGESQDVHPLVELQELDEL